MGFKKNNPGCKCCDSSGVPSDCQYCTVEYTILAVEVTGVADNNCDNCTTANGTHYLAHPTVGAAKDCSWVKQIVTTCNGSTSEVQVSAISTATGWTGRLQYNAFLGSLGSVDFTESSPPSTPRDCTTNKTLTRGTPYDVQGYCSWSSATFEVNP